MTNTWSIIIIENQWTSIRLWPMLMSEGGIQSQGARLIQNRTFFPHGKLVLHNHTYWANMGCFPRGYYGWGELKSIFNKLQSNDLTSKDAHTITRWVEKGSVLQMLWKNKHCNEWRYNARQIIAGFKQRRWNIAREVIKYNEFDEANMEDLLWMKHMWKGSSGLPGKVRQMRSLQDSEESIVLWVYLSLKFD